MYIFFSVKRLKLDIYVYILDVFYDFVWWIFVKILYNVDVMGKRDRRIEMRL